MNNLEVNDFLHSMKGLSKLELESIVQSQGIPQEKIEAAKSLLIDRSKSLDYARTQIEDEVDIDEILTQLKKDGISEEEASRIIQEASMNADLEKKENERIAEAIAEKEKGGNPVWDVIRVLITIFIIVRLIMRFTS